MNNISLSKVCLENQNNGLHFIVSRYKIRLILWRTNKTLEKLSLLYSAPIALIRHETHECCRWSIYHFPQSYDNHTWFLERIQPQPDGEYCMWTCQEWERNEVSQNSALSGNFKMRHLWFFYINSSPWMSKYLIVD